MKMSQVTIQNISPEDEYYVGCCTHINESHEIDKSSLRRVRWFHDMYKKGLNIKVAKVDNQPVGFIYAMPIEICPFELIGEKLLAIPCMFVEFKHQKTGIGKKLLNAVVEDADKSIFDGIVTVGFYHDFWYMPASFFEKNGFEVACKYKNRVLMWIKFSNSAKTPELVGDGLCSYVYKPEEKVVVDLFWSPFCFTTDIEAQRVREVVGEYGEKVILNDYNIAEKDNLRKYKIARGIYVNGIPMKLGEEASKEAIRDNIEKELNKKKIS